MKLFKTIIVLSSILLLHSCNKVDEISGGDVPGYSPILLSAQPAPASTRAYVSSGMYDNFKVHASSVKNGVTTTVMDGYNVRFVTDEWSYVSDSQPLMYWDNNADSYLFTAGAPVNGVKAISASSQTLHLENNTTESVMACEPLKIERTSPDFGKTVSLIFSYAHCRVCVAFIKQSAVDVDITDVKLTPSAPITSKADLSYAYNWNTTKPTATPQLSNKETSADALAYDNLTIPANKEDAVLSATRHYCVPDADNTKNWTVSLNCDGEDMSATFENTETWESGKNYIYVFALTEMGPKLIKVITQDDFFDCNDIESGGDFSNDDMTE